MLIIFFGLLLVQQIKLTLNCDKIFLSLIWIIESFSCEFSSNAKYFATMKSEKFEF